MRPPTPFLAFPLAVVLLTSARAEPAQSVVRSNSPVSLQTSGGPAKLLVIAPQLFVGELQPLIAHKNRTGMPAVLVTLESLRASFPGKDDPEKIKRAIASAREKSGTRYVMFVGDASLMPVRYRQVQQIPKDAPHTGTYNPSELYYSNLYYDHVPGRDAADPIGITSGRVFDTWDLNANGKFDEQHWNDDAVSYNPDHVDGCPDIALGRVPAHNEVPPCSVPDSRRGWR